MVKLEQRDITVAQKNELRRILKREGKSLIEMQSGLANGQLDEDASLTGLQLMAVVDKYLPYDFQVKVLQHGYEEYKHDETDLTDLEIAEMVLSVIVKDFWGTEVEKKS